MKQWFKRLGGGERPALPPIDPEVEQIRHGLVERQAHERLLTNELRRLEKMLAREGK